jgi:hypothetical protein
MTIIPKLVVLGLAATLSLPIRQHQIDYSMPGPEGQRITQLWLITAVNAAGLEVIIQAESPNGEKAPLITADPARLEAIMPVARDLAKTNHTKLRLIKLTNRVDVEDIVP